MFAQVAPRYDLLNHLLSGSLDRLWRRRAAGALGGPAKGPVLDLCCGTGDQALALTRRDHAVVAADFCVPMLALAQSKYSKSNGSGPAGLAADALELPFPDHAFPAVTVSFGLRNVASLEAALEEIHRVLAPTGKLVVLEFALPTAVVLRSLYQFYFRRLLPWIGRRISASTRAYQYLPDSVSDFPQRQQLTALMLSAGFSEASWRDLSGGTVCLYQAVANSPAPDADRQSVTELAVTESIRETPPVGGEPS
jgi:demethylmenaquinone methyltransferase/2-methoxy-6-polyprenyl-1,4-benzoquinol methylase